LDSFQRLADRAHDLGVVIAIENTHADRYIDYLLGRLATDSLQLCFDSSHDRLYAREPGALLNRWHHRLAALHLSDTDGRRDRHWLPGEGVVDFGPLQPYWNGTYTGVFMLESVPKDRSEPPARFLERAFEALRSVTTSPGAPADR
jgi:sugar phosphate isomerase/epimerase